MITFFKLHRMILYENDIKRLDQLRSYISSHLGEDLDRNILADKFGISSSTLDRHFFYYYKIRLYQYIRECRMEMAYVMLKTRRLNVSQVADQVGYQDRTAFTHAFTKYFGKSPLAVITEESQ